MEDSGYELRVKLSAKGKRVVKGHYSEHGRNPYGHAWHRNGEDTENSSDPQYHKVKHVWFKIMIPYGRNYDRTWLLNSIEKECGFHFRVFQFHYVNNMAAFFVDNFSTARSLVRSSRKIQGEHYHKIIINATPFHLPCDLTRDATSVDRNVPSPLNTMNYLDHSPAHIQMCLEKRYDRSLESLDLSNLSNDPGLQSSNVLLSFNNSSATELILRIISEYFPQLLSLNLSHNKLSKLTGFAHLFYLTPQLQSLNLSYNQLCHSQDLDLIHNLELRELWLEGNPLHASVESSSAYYRLITYHFPTIQKLDGLFFKQNLFFGQEEPKPLPQPQGSFFVSAEIKTFLMTFLRQYFLCYDSGERQSLLPLYHEQACCSFSLPSVFYPKHCFEQIKEYWKENRNLLKVKRPAVRQQLLKYNRLQVVGFLCNLPRTEHDLQSMILDVSLQMASLMCFTVEGKFKEVSTNYKNLFIPFRRTFVIVPASGTCAQILNDQMVINNSYVASQETASPKSSKAFLTLFQDAPATMTAHDDNVIAFSKYTGMKPSWALKCLEDNNWDVEQAKEIFEILKDRGIIPQEAFKEEELITDVSG
ncbi:nuclear RNA export factor 1-like isoform X2 [Mixophyes fleayi]|uniref:nuclear RNA export factor 1-like isoform X2 n=1 Tax=Mixophyes fleayi TaxID=3061075 RepID=UPI003F4DD610